MPRVLLIDDEEMLLQSFSTALRKAGFEVEVARNGRQGINAFSRQPPDAVITDIIMPEKEGIETIIELRRREPNLPIIAISGGGRDLRLEFLDAARKLGATRTLRKPVRLEELISTLRACLAGTTKS